MNVIHRTYDAAPESGDEQIVGGFITTANEDRHGDVVDPKGVDTSQLQVLLQDHKHDQPVGRLIDVEEREGGVYARFKVIGDEAWAKVKSGLLPAFSIGFIPRKAEPRKEGGWFYKAVEIIETSLVAIPSNRESQIVEVRNAEEAPMTTEVKTPVGVAVAPAVHTEVREYSLQRAMKSIIDQRVPDGMEGEVDSELKSAQPWREFGGCAVPVTEIFLSKQQKREIEKASGVYIPTNLAVLTGVEHRDELFALIDDAIGKQTLMGRAGVRTISGLMEDTVRIPRQTAMMSASHVAIDTDLQASDDPAFSNQDLKPRLVGSVSELSMSAVLAQHPRVGTDFIGNEMRRGLTQELERAFLNGSNGTNAAEPDGLISLADNTGTLAMNSATGFADFLDANKAYEDYTQETGVPLTWLLDAAFLDACELVPSFSGGTGETAADAMERQGHTIIRALNLPVPVAAAAGFFGDFSYFVHGIWQSADVALNPYADSVFAKKATLLRVSMLHDYQMIDPKRVLRVDTTV